ncbi:MAG: hypothetical protein RLZZ28_2261 [Bacteroidota bacterium]|jgi:hypothetical protein
MKQVSLLLLVIVLAATSCRWMGYKRIKGNGMVATENRSVNRAEKIKLAGSFDVEITQGPVASMKVSADQNLLPFIITSESGGTLLIKTKEHVNLSSDNPIIIYITVPKLEEIHLAGSGNIRGVNKFTDGGKLLLKIAGSGDIALAVNTPEITVEIAGSGTVSLSGETRNEKIQISGVGDFKGEDMKAENVQVKVAGSGDVKLFASNTLDVKIAGVGSVYYKGSPAVTQHVSGSGEVKKME